MVEPFLRENDEVSPANRRRLLEIFDDPQSCQDLRLELAALVDAGVHFVKASQASNFIPRTSVSSFTVQYELSKLRASVALYRCNALNPTAASLEELRNFPFANDDATIANLAQELPLYLAASDGVTVTCEDDKLTWWANHKETLPLWSSLVKRLLLIQPSSASAERVFSLLTNAFGSQQESALQDYLEASVMLRYNNAKRV